MGAFLGDMKSISFPRPICNARLEPGPQLGQFRSVSTNLGVANPRAHEVSNATSYRLHPLEAARQRLDMAAGLLTGDPVAGVGVFSREVGRQQEPEGLSDRGLLRKASREMLIAVRLVSEVLASQLPHLMATKRTETATLLNALTAGLRAAADGLEQFRHLPEQASYALEHQQ